MSPCVGCRKPRRMPASCSCEAEGPIELLQIVFFFYRIVLPKSFFRKLPCGWYFRQDREGRVREKREGRRQNRRSESGGGTVFFFLLSSLVVFAFFIVFSVFRCRRRSCFLGAESASTWGDGSRWLDGSSTSLLLLPGGVGLFLEFFPPSLSPASFPSPRRRVGVGRSS